MLVYSSYKFINEKIKYEKRSLYQEECTDKSCFDCSDLLTVMCLVPRELRVLGARLELYRDEDMSVRSIRAAR